MRPLDRLDALLIVLALLTALGAMTLLEVVRDAQPSLLCEDSAPC